MHVCSNTVWQGILEKGVHVEVCYVWLLHKLINYDSGDGVVYEVGS
jgi:hypothetical protein